MSTTSIQLLYSMFRIRYLQKALQQRLQTVLMEVISIDRSTFFLLHHSLDGILLVHETLEWAETSNQNLILLELDFSKALWQGVLGIFIPMPREDKTTSRCHSICSDIVCGGRNISELEWGHFKAISNFEGSQAGLSVDPISVLIRGGNFQPVCQS
jgi:hypothetical protein